MLDQTQREFFQALCLPLRGRSRKTSGLPESAEPHAAEFLAAADRLIRPSPALGAAECLELYHRQYWFRVLDSLEEDFPKLMLYLGEETFRGLAEAYLMAHPSRSFTLRPLGSRLPGFLAARLPDGIPNRRAVSIAAVEAAMMASFEAASPPVASPEDVASRPFTLQPHVMIIDVEPGTPEWMNAPGQAWPEDGAETVAVWRTRRGGATISPLEVGEASMLRRLADGPMALATWLAACENDIPGAEELSRWFSQWRDRMWFALPIPRGNDFSSHGSLLDA